MHKILRYYSQNRIKVWTTVFAIVFIIFVIQILNNAAKKEKNNTNKGETAFNVVSYHNESKSIITEGSVPQIYQKEFSNIIDEFYTYCINHEPEKAYELLAPDTKQKVNLRICTTKRFLKATKNIPSNHGVVHQKIYTFIK